MEFYGLRSSGSDVDFIADAVRYAALAAQHKAFTGFPPNTPGVKVGNADYFLSINGYSYEFFYARAVVFGKTHDGVHFLVCSKDDLVLLAAIRGYDERSDPPPPPESREKAFRDLDLLINGSAPAEHPAASRCSIQ
jgi:hypothetical protein